MTVSEKKALVAQQHVQTVAIQSILIMKQLVRKYDSCAVSSFK